MTVGIIHLISLIPTSVQLPGVAEEFSSTNEVHWPAYVAGDIIGYYVFPERRRIYKSQYRNSFRRKDIFLDAIPRRG